MACLSSSLRGSRVLIPARPTTGISQATVCIISSLGFHHALSTRLGPLLAFSLFCVCLLEGLPSFLVTLLSWSHHRTDITNQQIEDNGSG